jgi:hypothetical protein
LLGVAAARARHLRTAAVFKLSFTETRQEKQRQPPKTFQNLMRAGRSAGTGQTLGGVMPTKEEVFPSTYYNSNAVAGGPILLTIDFAQREPVGEGSNKTEKLIVRFKEKNSKLLVVTPTKWDAIALIAKSDDCDEWSGTQIVLEAGKAQLQGKLVDCVNIRPPRKPKQMGAPGAAPSKPPAPPAAEVDADFEDKIEF